MDGKRVPPTTPLTLKLMIHSLLDDFPPPENPLDQNFHHIAALLRFNLNSVEDESILIKTYLELLDLYVLYA